MAFDSEADGIGLAVGKVLRDGGWVERAAAAGVDLGAMRGGGLGALGFEFVWGAEAAVSFAFGEEPLGVLGVDRQALGLTVRAVLAFVRFAQLARAFVPVEAEPMEVFHQLGFMADFGAFQVSVFNAKDELAASAAGEEPVVEGGACIADVEQAGGGRGKADAGLGDHISNDDRRLGGVPRYANGSDTGGGACPLSFSITGEMPWPPIRSNPSR